MIFLLQPPKHWDYRHAQTAQPSVLF
jgi:hypothetical protein